MRRTNFENQVTHTYQLFSKPYSGLSDVSAAFPPLPNRQGLEIA